MDDNKPLYLWTINERGKLDRLVIKDWERVVYLNLNDNKTIYRFKDRKWRVQEINENDLDKYRYHRLLTFNGSYDNAWNVFSKVLFRKYLDSKYEADLAEKAYTNFKENNRRPTNRGIIDEASKKD